MFRMVRQTYTHIHTQRVCKLKSFGSRAGVALERGMGAEGKQNRDERMGKAGDISTQKQARMVL